MTPADELLRIGEMVSRLVYVASLLGLGGAALRYGPRVFALGADLVVAVTRMTDAIKSNASEAVATREATSALLAGQIRVEAKVDAMHLMLAQHVGVVPMGAPREPQPSHADSEGTRPRKSNR